MTMGRVAAIGERSRVGGLALAGVQVLVADGPEVVRRAWRDLPEGIDLVILTPAAAEALRSGLAAPPGRRPLTAVMPP
ncbi:V-type ATP synthase subunit F [Streptomyces sp. NPDC086080]|uniref:V-type ATP synthase subunit F n=1 Tax=Streptomyces sp. NPDC086080 TaxID=3365748 RepID=UPI0037D0C3AA